MIRGKKIVFRCDGNSEIGWGHVIRCVNLALWLHGKYKVYFVIKQDERVKKYISSFGFSVFEVVDKGNEEKFNEKVLNTILGFEPHVVVNDILDTKEKYMQELKNHKIKMVNIDDTSKNVKYTNAYIDANRKEKEGKCFGPKYIVISSIYHKLAKKKRKIRKNVKSILISYGGSDPLNLTDKTLSALIGKIDSRIELQVVLGPAYERKNELVEKRDKKWNIVFLDNPKTLAYLLRNVDIAVTGGGVTMFEAMALKTPTVVVAQNKGQAKNARKMEKREGILYLGEGDKISDKKITRKVFSLINDFDMREKLSENAGQIVDGAGIFRVLEQIEFCM